MWCCILKKDLYGLKQSPRVWFGQFTKVMLGMGVQIEPKWSYSICTSLGLRGSDAEWLHCVRSSIWQAKFSIVEQGVKREEQGKYEELGIGGDDSRERESEKLNSSIEWSCVYWLGQCILYWSTAKFGHQKWLPIYTTCPTWLAKNIPPAMPSTVLFTRVIAY